MGATWTDCPASLSARCSVAAKPQVLPASEPTKMTVSARLAEAFLRMRGRARQPASQRANPLTANAGTASAIRPRTRPSTAAPRPVCSIVKVSVTRDNAGASVQARTSPVP